MGKGDKKTRRGKIFMGSFGVRRPKPGKPANQNIKEKEKIAEKKATAKVAEKVIEKVTEKKVTAKVMEKKATEKVAKKTKE